jgi:hypothetical protein
MQFKAEEGTNPICGQYNKFVPEIAVQAFPEFAKLTVGLLMPSKNAMGMT